MFIKTHSKQTPRFRELGAYKMYARYSRQSSLLIPCVWIYIYIYTPEKGGDENQPP